MFTDCPPGPLDRYTSILRSLGSMSTSISSASGSTATGRRARVHPALALGDRHALHAVRPGLVLEPRPRVVALHHERDLAEAAHVGRLAVQHLELPAVARRRTARTCGRGRRPRGCPPRRPRRRGSRRSRSCPRRDRGARAARGAGRRARRAALPSSSISLERYSRISASSSAASSSRASARSASVPRYALYASTIGLSSACRRPASRAAAWSPEA